MIEISPATMKSDLLAYQISELNANLFLYLSELDFFEDYWPELIAEQLNRLSPEQKSFLIQRLEWEWETPESQKKLLREHLGLNTATEEEFRAKFYGIVDNNTATNERKWRKVRELPAVEDRENHS